MLHPNLTGDVVASIFICMETLCVFFVRTNNHPPTKQHGWRTALLFIVWLAMLPRSTLFAWKRCCCFCATSVLLRRRLHDPILQSMRTVNCLRDLVAIAFLQSVRPVSNLARDVVAERFLCMGTVCTYFLSGATTTRPRSSTVGGPHCCS